MGFFQAVMTPGFALEITGNGWTTGLDSTPIPISGVTLEFFEGPQGATWCTTSVDLSNRRAEYAGQWRLAPNVAGVPLGIAGGTGSLFGSPGQAETANAANYRENVSEASNSLGGGATAESQPWMAGFAYNFEGEE
jgi:hypothetical protein